MPEDISHILLPHSGKRVLRLGIAGNYGLQEQDLVHAADRGAGFWLFNPRYWHISRALKRILAAARDRHVVATLGLVGCTGGQVRRLAESSLRRLVISPPPAPR